MCQALHRAQKDWAVPRVLGQSGHLMHLKFIRNHGDGQATPHSFAETKQKWFTTIAPLQIADLLIQTTTPVQHLGCFEHRHMIHPTGNLQ